MDVSDEYRRQYAWRDWPRVLDALPPLAGRTVLDLGCGVGDQAADLVARGARVLGFDGNEELLRAARGRMLPGAEFHAADLRALPDPGLVADGLWCSFAAAYFPDLAGVLTAWARRLAPRGWVALTEVDDLFGHEPLRPRTRELLAAYAEDALAAGRYDFHMGGKLAGHVERSGFTVSRELALADRELSFHGPAAPGVLDAWRARLRRMRLLRDFCGPEMAAVEEDFLRCLARADHVSRASVRACIASLAARAP